MTKIARLVTAGAVAALAFLVPATAGAGAGEGPVFEAPLLITSAGQSNDVQLAVVLAKRAAIEHTLVKLATAKDLGGAKTLGLVVGASLKGLGAAGIDSVLVEGGGETAAAFLESGLVDRVSFFIAPLLLGGRAAVPAVGGLGAETVAEGIRLREAEWTRRGEDLLYTGRPERSSR